MSKFQEIEITLDEAKSFFKEHNDLSKQVKKSSISGGDDPKGILEFIGNEHNSFIFSKESMLSLFDKGAEYVLVALGAHNQDETLPNGRHFNKGSFTVFTVGYEHDESNNNILKPITAEHPAFEYPPKLITDDLDILNRGKFNKKSPFENDMFLMNKDSLDITIT